MKTNNNSRFTFLFFAVAALIALATRWLPHPDNFSAMGGLIFLAGYLFNREKAVLPVALAAILLGDLLIGTYPGLEWTYMAYAVIIGLGWFVSRVTAVSPSNRLAGVLVATGVTNFFAAAVFFVLSNIGVWLASGLYAQTAEGLRNCFLMAVPFFHMTLISQVGVAVLFVFAYERIAEKVEVVSRGEA